MISRGGMTWQTAFADLALILFLVVAAAHQEGWDGSEAEDVRPRDEERKDEDEPRPQVALGQPLAIYRPGQGEPLEPWLADQMTDDRQVATVLVRFSPGLAAKAADDGAGLVQRIEQMGRKTRLVVEPSNTSETMVVIAFDEHGEMAGTTLAER